MLAARSQTGDKVTVINGDRRHGHLKFDVEVHDVDAIVFRRRQRNNDADAVVYVFNGERLRVHVLLQNGAAALSSGDDAGDSDIRPSNVYARNVTTCSQQQQQLSSDEALTQGADAVFKCTLRSTGSTDSNAAKLQQQLLARIDVRAVFDRAAAAYACELRLRADAAGPLAAAYANVELELEAALGNGLAADRRRVRIVPAVQVTPQWLAAEQLPEQVITVRGVEAVLQQTEVSGDV